MDMGHIIRKGRSEIVSADETQGGQVCVEVNASKYCLITSGCTWLDKVRALHQWNERNKDDGKKREISKRWGGRFWGTIDKKQIREICHLW